MIKQIPVTPVREIFHCDTCDTPLKSTGQARGYPTQYLHMCESCNKGEWLSAAYPRINYITKDDLAL